MRAAAEPICLQLPPEVQLSGVSELPFDEGPNRCLTNVLVNCGVVLTATMRQVANICLAHNRVATELAEVNDLGAAVWLHLTHPILLCL